jgi:Zn-dependent protease with chaperone function
MRTLLKPLVFVLAIPILATVLGLLGRSEWDRRWSATLVRQLAAQRMRPDQRLLARYSLESLCSDSRTSVRLAPCSTYRLFSSVIAGSAIVGGGGFLFLGALLAGGALCRGSGRRLVTFFRPMLVAAAAGTAALALANAGLAVFASLTGITYLFGEPVERVSMSLRLVVMTAAIVWGLAMAVAAFSVTRRPTMTMVGRRLDPDEQPALAGEVRNLAEALSAPVPANIVACLSPVLFVTELKVACLDGVKQGPTLCLSLPLCRILSVDELRALVAHELVHFSSAQGGFARHVAPFHMGALRAIDRLRRQGRGIRAAAVAPPLALLGIFVDAVGGAGEPGVDREFDADAQAARAAGRKALGAALVKSQAFAPAWYAVAGAMLDAVSVGTQYVNASALFEEVVVSNTGPERLIGIGQQRHEHPTDRHPTLAERLTALQLDLGEVAVASLVTTPEQRAIALVADHERIEQGLSEAEHQLMRATGGELLEPVAG